MSDDATGPAKVSGSSPSKQEDVHNDGKGTLSAMTPKFQASCPFMPEGGQGCRPMPGYVLPSLPTSPSNTDDLEASDAADVLNIQRAEYPVSSNPAAHNASEIVENSQETQELGPRRGNRRRAKPYWYGFVATEILGKLCGHQTPLLKAMLAVKEPETFHEAVSRSNREEWVAAIEARITSLIDKDAIKLVPLPKGKKSIGPKWAYKTKTSNGVFDKCKACCVAKGYLQRKGIDYSETYALALRLSVFFFLTWSTMHGSVRKWMSSQCF